MPPRAVLADVSTTNWPKERNDAESTLHGTNLACKLKLKSNTCLHCEPKHAHTSPVSSVKTESGANLTV